MLRPVQTITKLNTGVKISLVFVVAVGILTVILGGLAWLSQLRTS